MTLSTTLNLRLNTELSNALDLVTPKALQAFSYLATLTSGAGLNQANVVWSDRRTVNASATDSLDVATGGGLVDALGAAVALARVKLIAVRNRGAQDIQLTRPAANGVPWLAAAGDAIPIVAGGLNLWVAPTAAGKVVTAGTGDLIDVVNGAGSSVDYDIVIIGASS